MSTRALGFSFLPILLAGLALSTHAQTQAPSAEQPVAAKDKTVIEGAYTRADANRDGKLTRQEAAKLPAISAKFDDLDTDKDGMLNLAEFSTAFAEAAK
jgi:Ca2+-binding EF-hand superfamily protein